MTALWIRAGTLLAGGVPLGVRLLSPLAALLGSVLLASAAADLLGEAPFWRSYRALAAALLLNATLLLGAGAVTLTPDTPLLFFWTACLASLGRLIATGRGAWWLAAGTCAGLALDGKYTALLPLAGLAAWLLATAPGRHWLRTPWPWAAAMLALLLFSPVIAWNAAHGWASFAKQGGRGGVWHPARAWRYLSELLGGQIGLATPLVFALMGLGLARIARHPLGGPPGETLLAWVTLPAVAVFVQHAFGDRVQANWPSLLYPAAAIAAMTTPRRWWRPAAALGFGLTALVYLQASAAPFALPRKLDVTLARLGGWSDFARDLHLRRLHDHAGFVVSDEFGVASELAFAGAGDRVLAAGPRWRLFRLPHPVVAGTGLLVRPSRRGVGPDPALFEHVVADGHVERRRAGRLAENYDLFRVTIRPAPTPGAMGEIAQLPTPRR